MAAHVNSGTGERGARQRTPSSCGELSVHVERQESPSGPSLFTSSI